MTPLHEMAREASCIALANPISCVVYNSEGLKVAAVIGVGVLIGWLLIQIVRVPIRFFGSYIDGSAFFSMDRPFIDLFVNSALVITTACLAISAFRDSPMSTHEAFTAALVGLLAWFHMWMSNRNLPVAPLAVCLGSQSSVCKSSVSQSKTQPTIHDDAAASLDAEWADIEEQIKAENANQKGN
ncbi:hypothetical protein ACTOV4_10125 [Brucella sp. C7-11G]